MAGVALSNIPGPGRELEDYVAGMFQAAGYFVEKNIRQRDFTDVLELDAVATSYEGLVPMSVLAEAKGGRWGFPDLFKIAGWMQYLGIDRGGFFIKDGAAANTRHLERVHRTIAPLGVSLVDLGDFSDPAARLGEGGFRPYRDPLLLEVWRFSFWVERTLLENLRQARRASPDLVGPAKVLAYHDLINDHVFFLRDVAERLRRLYAAHRDRPKLSLALASELSGGPFAAPRLAKNAVLSEAMYEGKHDALQASFYVEHRARLSILKAAIDLVCFAAAGRLSRDGTAAFARPSPGRHAVEAVDAVDAVSAVSVTPVDPGSLLAGLPATFREGLRRLRERPAFRRYALLWQVFLWGFGGFWLADREDEEFGWLSQQTGVPRDEIRRGLDAFDDLFPLGQSSWIAPVRGTSIRLVKMVPPAFRGVGAVQRLRRARARNYDGYRGMTRRTLISWHNGFVRLLRGPVTVTPTHPTPKPPARPVTVTPTHPTPKPPG